MNVLRDRVVAMCEALGFKGAGKWNKQRMEEKLKGLVAVADESVWSIDDPELAALLQSVVEAGGKVNVFKDQASLDAAGDDEPAVEEKPAEEKTLEHGPEVDEPAPKPEKVAKAPKTPKEPKPKKEKAAKAPKEKKGRYYFAGKVLKEMGLDSETTTEALVQVESLSGKSNSAESRGCLRKARRVLDGYLNG